LSAGDPASRRVPGASEDVKPLEFQLSDFKAAVAAAKEGLLQIKCQFAQTQSSFVLTQQQKRIPLFLKRETRRSDRFDQALAKRYFGKWLQVRKEFAWQDSVRFWEASPASLVISSGGLPLVRRKRQCLRSRSSSSHLSVSSTGQRATMRSEQSKIVLLIDQGKVNAQRDCSPWAWPVWAFEPWSGEIHSSKMRRGYLLFFVRSS
jgi:hypothetical protein